MGKHIRTRKIKMKPTPKGQKIIKTWFKATFQIYNNVVKDLNDIIENKKSFSIDELLKKFRNLYVTEAAITKEEDKWMIKVPSAIRDGALLDALDAFKTEWGKRAKNHNHQFTLHERTWNGDAYSYSLRIPVKAIKQYGTNRTIYPKSGLGHINYCLKKKDPFPVIKHECRLQRTTSLGHFFLCVPLDRDLSPPLDRNGQNPRIVALDPGNREFSSGYDPSGFFFSIAGGSVARLDRLAYIADEFKSAIDRAIHAREASKLAAQAAAFAPPTSDALSSVQVDQPPVRILTARQIRNRTRVYHTILEKMHDIVDDLHKKFASFLVRSYDLILLPNFRPSSLVRKLNEDGNRRKINSKAVRNMLSWGHGAFRRFLLARAELSPCVVDLVCEAYTSKTCGRCGELNERVGTGKDFDCPNPNCGYAADRDANAARNILIRNATKYLLDAYTIIEPCRQDGLSAVSGPKLPLVPSGISD